jgi:hypothetical protein
VIELPPRLFHDAVVGESLPAVTVAISTSTIVLGALAARDDSAVHHDRDAAQARGLADVFADQPTQAAWLERIVTEWAGPRGRLGRLTFAMRIPIIPGDALTVVGQVTGLGTDAVGCGWVDVDLALVVDGRAKTTGTARVALPMHRADNPWDRRGANWMP